MSGSPDRAPWLVLRALGLGDALTAVPALRALRRSEPGRPVVLAASGEPAELLLRERLVDAVVPTRGLDGPPPGRLLGPHHAVNLHGRGPQSHRLLLAGAPLSLLAFGSPEAGVPGPVRRPDEHEVLRWLRLVAAAGGHGGPEDLRLTRPPAPALLPDGTPFRPGRTVLLHPGASAEARCWPAARWAVLARRLAVRGMTVLVTGGPGDRSRTGPVVRAAGTAPGGRVVDLAGRTPLPALAALVGAVRLVVCGDTGVAHLATAYGTGSVLLFGPTPPARWGPLADPGRHRVLWAGASAGDRAGRPGDPQAGRPDPALLRITVADVLAAVDGLLDQLPAGVPDEVPAGVRTEGLDEVTGGGPGRVTEAVR